MLLNSAMNGVEEASDSSEEKLFNCYRAGGVQSSAHEPGSQPVLVLQVGR